MYSGSNISFIAFGFNPEKVENCLNGSTRIKIDSMFCKKKVVSPAEAVLTLKDLFISESCIEINIALNFYFHTLWCLKRLVPLRPS